MSSFGKLKMGDTVMIDGISEIVESLHYGDGLISHETKTSKPVVVTFRSGRTISAAPTRRV